MLEIQLAYLGTVKRDALDACDYLRSKAQRLRDRGFLPEMVFEKIEAFNLTRNRVIHRLVTGKVTLAESKSAAESVRPIYGEIQDRWLKLEIGPERWVP